MKKVLILFVFICSISVTIYPQSPRRFSVKEIKGDLEYLRNTLESAHYNLYAYTKKEVFDSVYREIDSSIKDSLTSLQINRLFQPYTALSKIGHCSADLPINDYVAYLEKGGNLFPFNVYFSNSQVYIQNNFSADSSIVKGDEIASINGKSMEEVMNGIYRYLSGESNYFKNAFIDQILFPRIYWIVHDRCDTFSLEIKEEKGTIVTKKVNAILGGEFERKWRTQQKTAQNEIREFRFVNDIPYLQPGPFMNPSNQFFSNKTFDTQMYLHFMDSCFTEIHKKGSECLIVDLRNNPGGMSIFSMPLVSYFAKEPFSSVIKVTYKTSQATKDGLKNITDSVLTPDDLKLKNDLLSHKNGSFFESISNDKYFPQNDSLRFKGKVYILVNRHTYSEAIEASALIQDYKFGIIVGEMTPNTATMYASIQQFKLPNTQLNIQYPRAFLERKNKQASLIGVIPDYQIEDNPLTDKDEILDYTIELLCKKK